MPEETHTPTPTIDETRTADPSGALPEDTEHVSDHTSGEPGEPLGEHDAGHDETDEEDQASEVTVVIGYLRGGPSDTSDVWDDYDGEEDEVPDDSEEDDDPFNDELLDEDDNLIERDDLDHEDEDDLDHEEEDDLDHEEVDNDEDDLLDDDD